LIQRRKSDLSNKEWVFGALRREILAARLKVTLDEQLGRESSPTVQRLSKMKLPPLVRQNRSFGEASEKEKGPHRRKYDPTSKEQLFETLRREVLAARLKATLDEQLGRETSPTVQRLSKMKLPPIVQGVILFGNVRSTLLVVFRPHRDGS
jgi:hypothetical protein